jgi:hypothetical protein
MSNVLIHPEKVTGTAVSGGFSVNTIRLNGMLRQVICKPTTSTTTYDIKIVNPDASCIYERTGEVGNLAEETAIAIHGIHTVTIENATVDEAFEIQLITEY